MKRLEPIRLAGLGLLIILLQHTWYLSCPELRAGVDLFVVFLLLITAVHGSLLASIFALVGGLLMDAPSDGFVVFHMFYYLIPVLAGSMVRSAVLFEFKLYGVLAVGVLLFLKILIPFFVGLATGWLDSGRYLLTVNYWPLLILVLIIGSFWGSLTKLVPTAAEVKRLGA